MQMKKFEISTDSTSDLYYDEIKDLGVYVGRMSYTLTKNNQLDEYLDNFEKYEQYIDFYNQIRQGAVARTSMLNVQAHINLFTKMAEDGVKRALHISLSDGLSPTVDAANKAIEIVKEKYPDIDYIAIESKSATVGEGILVKIACDMRDKGFDRKDVVGYLQDNKNKLQHIIMVDDLTCLKRGGRLSGAKAVIATILNIKPIIEIGKNGKLDVVRKEIGVKKAMKSMVEEFKKHTLNKDYPKAIIVHCDNEPRALELQKMIEAETGIVPEIRIMGPVIGAHVGPGGIAIGYFSNEERPF